MGCLPAATTQALKLVLSCCQYKKKKKAIITLSEEAKGGVFYVH